MTGFSKSIQGVGRGCCQWGSRPPPKSVSIPQRREPRRAMGAGWRSTARVPNLSLNEQVNARKQEGTRFAPKKMAPKAIAVDAGHVLGSGMRNRPGGNVL